MTTHMPPAPPTTPFPPADRKRRRTLILVAAATGAGLLALGATGVATYEAGKAAGEAQRASLAAPATTSTQPPTPGAASLPPATDAAADPGTPAGAATPTPNAIPSDINPSAQFTPAYQLQQQLQLRAGGSCQLQVDLDEPRVNVDSAVADLDFERCSTNPTLGFTTGTTASVASNPNATPSECAESIRTSGLGNDARVPVQPNTVLCVATSRTAALDKGITRKIAVVVVKTVATDGTVTLVVSAWNVPS